ncbi:MAG: hypothetical protein V1837_07450 [Candidatus Woesearchaeota archaeon]
MEKFEDSFLKAKRHLQIADHMVYVTYGLVKDPRLLLSVLDNVFLAFTNSMSSILHYENLFKRVPPFPDNFEAKFALFRESCLSRYNIHKDYLPLMRELKGLIVAHKKSPVEFARNDRFVICSDDYRMQVISVEQIKCYVAQAKLFIQDISVIIKR